MKYGEVKCMKDMRTLELYVRLSEGRIINKAEEAVYYGVSERTIQRDIEDIRAFLAERALENGAENRNVVYNKKKKGFVMEGTEGSLMTNSEILSVSKILLESRAFSRKEIEDILDKLIAGCVPLENMKLVSDLIANEKFHYVELKHKSYIQDKLWELGVNIMQHNMIELTYKRQQEEEDYVKRIVEPIAIMFSEYYFYLNAYIVEKDSKDRYVHMYDFPAIFRIDRIKKCKRQDEKFHITYGERFQDGELRKRIQFMYAGELVKTQIKYTGKSVEAVLDRFPTAKIIKKCEDGYVIEVEAYGKGMLMWLLSQGTMVEVLKPESLRQKMKEMLEEMVEKYKANVSV